MLELTPAMAGPDIAAKLNATSGPIILLPGTYPQLSTLDLSKLDKWIRGYGATFEWHGPAGGTALVCKPNFSGRDNLFSHGVQLTGVHFDGMNVCESGAVLDGVAQSQFDFKFQNFTKQGVRVTATRPSQSSIYNQIRVTTINCGLGFSIDGEADLANTCLNEFWVRDWYTKSSDGVSARLGFSDNNRFPYLETDGIVGIDVTKCSSNVIRHGGFGGLRLVNTAIPRPAGMSKNKIEWYDVSNGEPGPVCDSDHLPEEFLVWTDSLGNQHGIALPHFYIPGVLTVDNFPKMPDRNWFTFYDGQGPVGFGMGTRENGNPWSDRMKFGG